MPIRDVTTNGLQIATSDDAATITTAVEAVTTEISTTSTTLQTAVDSIDTKTPDLGQEVMAASLPVVIASNQSAIPVSIGSIALPTGASTSALQSIGNTSLATLATNSPALVSGRIPVDPSGVTSPVSIAGTITVDASGHTVPVSGTFYPVTQPISAVSLPLPTGAATDATLTGGTAKEQITDGTNVAAVKAASTAAVATDPALVVAISPNNTVPVSIAATLPVSGTVTVTQTTAANLVSTVTQGPSGSSAWKVDGSAVTQPVSAVSLPLPTSAATSTLQSTGNTSLATLVTNSPALASGRIPVDPSGVTSPVSIAGNVAITAATLPLPTGAATLAKQPALGTAGTASSDVITVQGIASMTALKVDGSGVTQPISVVSLPLPSGAAQDSTLTGGTAKTRITDGTNTATIKAASTAAIATDTALVVAVSPNNVVTTTTTLPTTVQTGAKVTVVTPGTAVQLPSKILSSGVIVQALSTNSGNVWVGDSTVLASTGHGIELQPGQATAAGISNVNLLYIDAFNTGDGICYLGS